MYSIIDIGVIETPVLVKDSSDKSLKVVPVRYITILP
jgi:hypothetical protein